jgi:hypothetical protein
MPKQRKGAFHLGMEKIMNDPNSSFLTNPQVFSAVKQSSGMSYTEILRHIGKGGKKVKGPTDAERSKQRVEKLESDSEE